MSDDFAGANFEDNDEGLLIDLSTVEESSYGVLPKGLYNCTIEKCEYKISKASKPMWSVQFNIDDGEYAGKKLFAFISFSDKALPGTKTTIKRIAPEFATQAFNPKTSADSMVGKPCRCKVDIDTYEGTTRNTVKQILAAGIGASDGFAI